jgi:hypothetical protein
MLIDAGAHLEIVDIHGKTAMSYAVENERDEPRQVLLAAGAKDQPSKKALAKQHKKQRQKERKRGK